MRIGYARLSEDNEALPVQRPAFQAASCGQVDEERTRGQTTRRPQRAAVALKALRACGRRDGRPRKLRPEALQAVRALRADGQVPMRAIAARFGVAPSTLYRSLAEPPAPEPSQEPLVAYA
jgi:DNA invertase Pin-like site-specific DNA recombinase